MLIVYLYIDCFYNRFPFLVKCTSTIVYCCKTNVTCLPCIWGCEYYMYTIVKPKQGNGQKTLAIGWAVVYVHQWLHHSGLLHMFAVYQRCRLRSLCQFVCLFKALLYVAITWQFNKIKLRMCTKTVQLSCISNSFLFNYGIASPPFLIRLTPSMCLHSPAPFLVHCASSVGL